MRTSPTRRHLLLGGGLTALTGTTLLTGCSGETGPANSPSGSDASSPTTGGTLRAAFVGGGAAETLNYFKGPTSVDYVRARAAHGALGVLDPEAEDGVRYLLLEGIDAAPDLSSYTLRVRPGLTFTDGSPVTATDVLYSLQAATTLGALPFLLPPTRLFTLDAAQVTDENTLVLPTAAPIADGREVLCQSTLVIKDGTTDFTVDTPTCGPFRLTSFEAGQGAAYERHDGWTVDGGAKLDGLEILTIADSAARSNALTGGQVEYADGLSPVSARTLSNQDGITTTTSEVPYVTPIVFALNAATVPEFGDVRVRRAFKLAADRQAMVDSVLYGAGVVGNDLPAIGFPGYAGDLEQREHDPEQARELLAQAGADGMSVTFTTGPEISGMLETATLYAENLRGIGVDVTLDERAPGQLFSDPNYFTLPMTTSYSPPQPLFLASASGSAGSPAAFGYADPQADALFAQARSTADAAERASLLEQAQRLRWENGNTVIPVFTRTVSAQSSSVTGIGVANFTDFSSATVR
ncbi:ABC transporter substrate-binding protein [Kineococcus sp. TBRC 1896]|uniref:ABC transporter substrate-binding protein n=1 Tax=Kineococcus mangrovi TaxID=1660183 RepID=A0ABV4I077_9ACTN